MSIIRDIEKVYAAVPFVGYFNSVYGNVGGNAHDSRYCEKRDDEYDGKYDNKGGYEFFHCQPSESRFAYTFLRFTKKNAAAPARSASGMHREYT